MTLTAPLSAELERPARAGTDERPVPAWKRASDIVFACLLLVPSLPLMAVAALAVKVTSPGPVVYSQVRLGRNRKPFRMLKLRSMTYNCEAKTGAVWAKTNDARITPVGWLLRKTHIDELPQLFNILAGDMSLVGPRPERPELIATLEPQVPGYGDRMKVNAGLTGLAQVQLPPDTDIDSVHRKVRYDRYYGTHATFWLDVKLCFATFLNAIGLPFKFSQVLFGIPDALQVEPENCVSDLPHPLIASAQQA